MQKSIKVFRRRCRNIKIKTEKNAGKMKIKDKSSNKSRGQNEKPKKETDIMDSGNEQN